MTTPASSRRFLMLWLLLFGSGFLMMAGCGGGSHVSKKSGKGAAVFTIKWPPQTKNARLISAASNLVRIQISAQPNGGGASYGFQDAVRPHVDGQLDLTTPITTLTFNNLPPGAFYATANGYPGYQSGTSNPAGAAQTTATVPLTIADGQTTTTNLTMASTIARAQISVGDRLVLPKGQFQRIDFVGYDAANAVVLTSVGQIHWQFSNPQVASFVTGPSFVNTLIGAQRGVEQITATDQESGKSAACAVIVPGLALSAWPKFHQNEMNQGLSAALPGTVGAQKWATQTGGPVRSSPAIGVDGTIYVGSDIKNIYAFNGATGALKWAFPTDGLISSSPTVGADGTIYVATENGTVYALADNGTSATQKWAYTLGAPVLFSSPTIGRDGTIYIGTDDGKIHALTDNGSSVGQKWEISIGVSVHSSPALGLDGTIYVTALVTAGFNYAKVYALTDNGASASIKTGFSYASTAANSSPVVSADGTIYVSLNDRLYSLIDNGSSFTINWFVLTSNLNTSSPAIGANGVIYVGDDSGHVYAYNSAGTSKWTSAPGGSVTSSPAIGADGTIYVGTKNAGSNKVYALTDGGTSATQKWAFPTGDVESSPAIGADGTVFFGSDDQQIYAIK